MHLAVALGVPVVSIFGPTDPLWIGPFGQPRQVVRSSVACAPCYLRALRSCPHDHACMRSVTPEMVIERVQQTVAGVPGQPQPIPDTSTHTGDYQRPVCP